MCRGLQCGAKTGLRSKGYGRNRKNENIAIPSRRGGGEDEAAAEELQKQVVTEEQAGRLSSGICRLRLRSKPSVSNVGTTYGV